MPVSFLGEVTSLGNTTFGAAAVSQHVHPQLKQLLVTRLREQRAEGGAAYSTG